MIDVSLAIISQLSVHRVGNKHNGDDIFLSKAPIAVDDNAMQEKLLHFFLSSMPLVEKYSFKTEIEHEQENPLRQFSKEIFQNRSSFHLTSIQIAKRLFDVSMHPQIKPGDVFVAHLKNIAFDGENCEAIGIFKSENKQSFFQVLANGDQAELYLLDGINLDKLDKGAIIFNQEAGDGYRVCILDRNNKSTEAEFWKDLFLNTTPCNDEYQQTKQYMSLAKTFVTTQYVEDFEVEKPEQIEMLQKSVEYFKTHDNFDKREFEEEVLQYPEVIKSFQNFNHQFQEDNEIVLEDSFEISTPAVKKQQSIFKSIIKLDKNFHIYVHGNRELIEKGVEPDGRKFYKIYYKEEE
jgi:hypothetical protein